MALSKQELTYEVNVINGSSSAVERSFSLPNFNGRGPGSLSTLRACCAAMGCRGVLKVSTPDGLQTVGDEDAWSNVVSKAFNEQEQTGEGLVKVWVDVSYSSPGPPFPRSHRG